MPLQVLIGYKISTRTVHTYVLQWRVQTNMHARTGITCAVWECYMVCSQDDLANAGSADGKPKGPGTGANMLRGSTPQPTNPSASFKSGEGDLSMSDKGGDYSNKVPFQDYYYYDQGEGGKPKDT